MKKIILACALAAAVACNPAPKHPAPVNPNATPEARELLAKLYKTVDEGKIISGIHGTRRADLERIAEASDGKAPLLYGGDMGWNPQMEIDRAVKNWEEGKIVTLMWHSQRPYDVGETNFSQQCQGGISDEDWAALMTEGSEMHRMWLDKIDEVAGYLKQLRDKNIPVLWRPYHEMNGEWFWWGDKKGEDGFAKLYRMMYDRYVNYHHLDNLLWVWNANGPRNTPDNAYAYDLYYPGNDYVDVLATDIYHKDWKQSHHDELIELGGGKLIALGEIGNVPSPEVLKTQNKYAWFMIWSGFTSERNNTLEELGALFNRPETLTYGDEY